MKRIYRYESDVEFKITLRKFNLFLMKIIKIADMYNEKVLVCTGKIVAYIIRQEAIQYA